LGCVDQPIDIALGETESSAPAECRAAVENINSDSQKAPGRRGWRHKPKVGERDILKRVRANFRGGKRFDRLQQKIFLRRGGF